MGAAMDEITIPILNAAAFEFLRELGQRDGLCNVSKKHDAKLAAELDAAGLVHWTETRRPGSTVRGQANITDKGRDVLNLLADYAQETTDQNPLPVVVLIEDDTAYAYCDASGLIAFGPSVPEWALPIARGPLNTLRERVEVVARHAYDGHSLLVPGVPEAEDQMQAVEALIAFRKWIKPGFEKAGLTV